MIKSTTRNRLAAAINRSVTVQNTELIQAKLLKLNELCHEI